MSASERRNSGVHAEGEGHILLWLEAVTAETGNDWGDGLRSLTLGAAPAPADDLALQPAADLPVDESAAEQRPGRKRLRRLSRTNQGDRSGAE